MESMAAQREDEAAEAAIKALGSLFKLTQVFLWDDDAASTTTSNMDSAPTPPKSSSSSDDTIFVEQHTGLAQQMNALGLPLSFKTSNRGNTTKRPKLKKNIIRANNPNSDRQDGKDEIGKCHCSSNESLSSLVYTQQMTCVYHDCSDMTKSEKVLCSPDGNCETVNANSEGSFMVDCPGITMPETSVVESSATTDRHLLNDQSDIHYGDWRQFWDDFYMRNYFYNITTRESTWDLPPELEYIWFSGGQPKPSEKIVDADDAILEAPSVEVLDPSQLLNNVHLFENNGNCSLSGDSYHNDGLTSFSEINTNPVEHASLLNTEEHISDHLSSEEDWRPSKADELDVDGRFSSTNQVSDAEESLDAIQLDAKDELGQQNPSLGKKKKVRRRTRQSKVSNYNTAHQFDVIPQEFPDGIVKYWCQRYSLFSLYDDGIKMDEEGWFSVTPEPIARHHAMRCGDGVVIDSFTGVGGNAIQLAKKGNRVIAVDIDPQKIEFAQHNAAIYGVDGHIDFVNGDFFQLAPKMKADTVFLSPPWGGPDYAKVESYNINTMLKPHDGYFLFNTSKRIAPRIILFLPRNVDLNQLAELSLLSEPPWMLEVEKNFLNGKLKAITAYFSCTKNVEGCA